MAKSIALTTVKISTKSVKRVQKNKKATGVGIGRFYEMAADMLLESNKEPKLKSNA